MTDAPIGVSGYAEDTDNRKAEITFLIMKYFVSTQRYLHTYIGVDDPNWVVRLATKEKLFTLLR